MEIESAWSAFDIYRNVSSTASSNEYAEYLCDCGGIKEFNEDCLPVCTSCGKCADSYISDEPEWRGGMDDDGKVSDPSRVGAPSNTDHFSAAWNTGTLMRAGPNAANKRLAKINFFTQGNHKDRSLFHAYAQMDLIGKTILNLPDAIMYAAKIKYRAFNEAVLTRGAVRAGVKANCVFQACKEFGVPRTTKEIADAFSIKSRDVSRTSSMYKEQNPAQNVSTTGAANLVSRIFSNIEIEDKSRVRMKVIATCQKLEESVKLQGRTPKAIACAVIYVVLAGKISKADVCRVCEVSLPTLAKIEPIVLKELQTF